LIVVSSVTVSKQQLLQPVPRAALVSLRRLRRSYQVAQGLVLGVRHPNGRQIATAEKACQLLGVTAVRLHSIARLRRYEDWGHHVAGDPEGRQLPVENVAAGTGFVADAQSLGRPQLLDQPANAVRSIRNRAHGCHRTLGLASATAMLSL
jgi:hypothetical protein